VLYALESIDEALMIWNMIGKGGLSMLDSYEDNIQEMLHPVTINNYIFGEVDFEIFKVNEKITLPRLLKFCDLYSFAYSLLFEAFMKYGATENCKKFYSDVMNVLKHVAVKMGLKELNVNKHSGGRNAILDGNINTVNTLVKAKIMAITNKEMNDLLKNIKAHETHNTCIEYIHGNYISIELTKNSKQIDIETYENLMTTEIPNIEYDD
jgi:hypothetical protein